MTQSALPIFAAFPLFLLATIVLWTPIVLPSSFNNLALTLPLVKLLPSCRRIRVIGLLCSWDSLQPSQSNGFRDDIRSEMPPQFELAKNPGVTGQMFRCSGAAMKELKVEYVRKADGQRRMGFDHGHALSLHMDLRRICSP